MILTETTVKAVIYDKIGVEKQVRSREENIHIMGTMKNTNNINSANATITTTKLPLSTRRYDYQEHQPTAKRNSTGKIENHISLKAPKPIKQMQC